MIKFTNLGTEQCFDVTCDSLQLDGVYANGHYAQKYVTSAYNYYLKIP
jgi:hypothetical protein